MSRVLVVDDNRDLADNLVEIFESEGHEVKVAYSGEHALRRAVGFQYDAALVDIRMPDMDGVSLVYRLMRTHPSSHYLFMTGASRDRTLAEAAAVSQRAVLAKPVDIERVLRILAVASAAN